MNEKQERELKNREKRVPSITREQAQVLQAEKMDKQWSLLVEAIRSDLQANPEIRSQLIKFCGEPVSETLPWNFVNSLSDIDPRMEKLTGRYKEGIEAYLNLPPVPDELIIPDIKGGRITKDEKEMVARRYRFARSVKILSLGAEILDQKKLTPNEKGEIVLPSGIKVILDASADKEKLDLLSPHLWQRRRQLKDRVYEIEVNNRKYILKEKKTPRHIDTMRHGHKDGVLSSEEFAIAKKMQEEGSVKQGRIELKWEKPVGFVLYPDGFQFAIFEYERGLIPIYEIHDRLTKEILKHRKQFEEEYNLIANLLQRRFDTSVSLSWSARLKEFISKITFSEFAHVKSYRMIEQAYSLMGEMRIRNGYYNEDSDGYAYKIDTNRELRLEIIGFDFEYFFEMLSEDRVKFLELYRNPEKKNSIVPGLPLRYDFTRNEKAADLAMQGIGEKGVSSEGGA